MSTAPNPETPLPKTDDGGGGAVSPRDKTALKHLELLAAAGDERVDRNEAKGLFGDWKRRRRLALVEERRTYGRVVVAIAELSGKSSKCFGKKFRKWAGLHTTVKLYGLLFISYLLDR